MVKDTLKALFALVVAGFVALPAPAVQALTLVRSADDIIENMADAESVEFSVDIDVETMHEQLDQPITVHIDADGASNVDGDRSMTLGLVSTDEYGNTQEAGGTVLMIGDTLYLSETGGEWYFIEGSSGAPTDNDVDDGVEEMQELMSDLLDRGVISYDPETAERVNGTWAVRYAYEVDMARLTDYLIDAKQMSEDEAEAIRTADLGDVTIHGNLWIDTSEMLPVKFTMHIDAFTDATSYTTIDISVWFESFNEDVNIVAPKHATNLEDADFSKTEDSVEATLDMTVANMDIDGDGLTNADEETLWHSNPLSDDTDGDGYLDYTEVVNGYNPNGVGKLDSDGDGLTDYAEMTIHWSDRYDADSDNDGYPDGLEIANGYDPNGKGKLFIVPFGS